MYTYFSMKIKFTPFLKVITNFLENFKEHLHTINFKLTSSYLHEQLEFGNLVSVWIMNFNSVNGHEKNVLKFVLIFVNCVEMSSSEPPMKSLTSLTNSQFIYELL